MLNNKYRTVVLKWVICIVIIVAAGLFPDQKSVANEENTVYLQIDYYSLEKGAGPEFKETKKELWKPVQEKRISRGDISGWSIYEALVTGISADYQFVAITIAEDFSSLYGAGDCELLTQVFSDKELDMVLKKMHRGYTVSHSEIWKMEGAALPEGSDGPTGNYITKNFMDARGASGEHETMELNFWKPIHYVRIDQDILNSWAMYTIVKPGGASSRYNYSTIDYYDRLADIEGSVGMELARIAHPDVTDDQLSDYFSRTGRSRTAYKTEMWRKVISTTDIR